MWYLRVVPACGSRLYIIDAIQEVLTDYLIVVKLTTQLQQFEP